MILWQIQVIAFLKNNSLLKWTVSMNGEFLRGKRPNFREQQPDKNLCKIKMA